MPTRHIVKPGDCIESIALEYGHFAGSLWQHPENAELRRLRADPHVLVPGDVVHVPDREPKTVRAATQRRHVARRRGVPAKFRVVLEEDGEPRVDLPYELRVDGVLLNGRTGPAGEIEHWISPSAKVAELTISDVEIYRFRLGRLLPVTEHDGVRARLENLGYLARPPVDADDTTAPETLSRAITAFQTDRGLVPNGIADDATCTALLEAHGS